MFRVFEKLVAPYPNGTTPALPQGFFPFLWACARGARRLGNLGSVRVQTDVERRGGVGEGADADHVDAGLGDRAHALQRHAAGGLQHGLALGPRHGDAQLIEAEVVEHDHVRAFGQGLAELIQAVDLGLSGPGSGRSLPVRMPPRGSAPLRPGEGKGSTALFNPDRTYRPDWDGKLVPGATMGLPNSPNDYKEGVTLAHPAAGATQSAPGEPPMMKPSSGGANSPREIARSTRL